MDAAGNLLTSQLLSRGDDVVLSSGHVRELYGVYGLRSGICQLA